MKISLKKSGNIIYLSKNEKVSRESVVELKCGQWFPDDLTRWDLEVKNELGMATLADKVFLKWKIKLPNDPARAIFEAENELGIINIENKTKLKWLKKLNNDVNAALLYTKYELNEAKISDLKELIQMRKLHKHLRNMQNNKSEQQTIEMNAVADDCIKEYGKVIEFNKNIKAK